MAFIASNRKVPTSINAEEISNPSELRILAKKNNISLFPFDIEALAYKLGIQILREDGEDDFSGCIEKRFDDRYYISVNKYHNIRRQRFTIAHELGHYILHRNKLNEIGRETILMREPTALSKIEREANDFASELLIPKETLDAQMQSGMIKIEDLADFFNVSVPAMKYRAINLGYLRIQKW
ncbi:ImmA/IrrE family metallo-endopeptidase [Leptospira bourretii]|uniref:ImmA/IrrE family metallo-endopeptidase n=1 Tax=Leptospira bourretii TaxID=2484962 RepID=A0A4R9IS59_9LEPT|nr:MULTISPECIES: ImmA/IrrE family metallo-endopeptidase [Leptospira]TGK79250.1 ImmA/IrrE family metallo-endopeptidase [Leptospira bourretii]TGK94363.1 ImmA/IrrE family metallo-endopeptidase [Leptospira bourretii]TGL16786.1 ImmA/IrrE family metallo-endopeptidase [Leptospira levettii]TGL38816.1 ImmA/IrrE family metallo-endopeptidase [Leptospira bourretii]